MSLKLEFAILSMVLGSLLGFIVCGVAHAQTESYRIGPRDVIALSIYAGGELQSQVDLTVSGKGTINVPFIGPVQATGRTVMELETLVTKPLAKDYFVNPEVNIAVKEYHSLQYYISGAVKTPGLYKMTSEPTLLELIAKAEGLLPSRGNVAYIQRKYKGQTANKMDIKKRASFNGAIKVDLKKLLDQGDMSHNLSLESGDLVYIPLGKVLDVTESKIYVAGRVRRPGSFDFQPGMTALSACIMAGGFTVWAKPQNTKLIRQQGDKRIVIKINLRDVREGNIADIKLQPGDKIYVTDRGWW
ncbi:MAG: polysaccharide biosynthesis/export family protein [Desulfobacterales bacterium]|jgi:polysaccharide export outer membrane protein